NGVTHSSDKPPAGQPYEVRRVDGQYAAEIPGDEPAAESAACASARRSLSAFEDARPVQVDTDGDGKPDRTLSDEERQSHRGVAGAAVTANCPAAGAARAARAARAWRRCMTGPPPLPGDFFAASARDQARPGQAAGWYR